jgi:hypothetical protein
MPAGKVMKREWRVATSIALTVTFWRHPSFWRWVLGLLALSLTLHFIWRWKTKAWTQPWGGWNDVESADRE